MCGADKKNPFLLQPMTMKKTTEKSELRIKGSVGSVTESLRFIHDESTAGFITGIYFIFRYMYIINP